MGDPSDSELAESESDLRCSASAGATSMPATGPTQGERGSSSTSGMVCLLMDVDYWWHASRCPEEEEEEAATHSELFESSLCEIEKAVGPVLHITARNVLCYII